MLVEQFDEFPLRFMLLPENSQMAAKVGKSVDTTQDLGGTKKERDRRLVISIAHAGEFLIGALDVDGGGVSGVALFALLGQGQPEVG